MEFVVAERFWNDRSCSAVRAQVKPLDNPRLIFDELSAGSGCQLQASYRQNAALGQPALGKLNTL